MKNVPLLRTLLAVLLLAVSGCMVMPPGPHIAPGPPPPPSVRIPEPGYLYLVPTWGVYFVPGTSVDILFYDGLWYYHVTGTWYWSRTYEGPWSYLGPDRVPLPLRKLPPDYRTRYGTEPHRVPYGHWKKRWTEPPPATRYGEPGYLYQVPGSRVYAYPGTSVEIYFYGDRWYHRYNGIWYWSWSYNGPWAYIEVERTPSRIRELPHSRQDRERYKKVPWGKPKGKGENRQDGNDEWKP